MAEKQLKDPTSSLIRVKKKTKKKKTVMGYKGFHLTDEICFLPVKPKPSLQPAWPLWSTAIKHAEEAQTCHASEITAPVTPLPNWQKGISAWATQLGQRERTEHAKCGKTVAANYCCITPQSATACARVSVATF